MVTCVSKSLAVKQSFHGVLLYPRFSNIVSFWAIQLLAQPPELTFWHLKVAGTACQTTIRLKASLFLLE